MGDNVVDKVVNKLVDKSMMNTTQSKVLELIRDNPNITQIQIAEKLGLGKTSIQNNISFLKKKGYIIRRGSNKLGYWEVK